MGFLTVLYFYTVIALLSNKTSNSKNVALPINKINDILVINCST